MAELHEVTYEYNGLNYKIVETLEMHNRLRDIYFFEQYMRENCTIFEASADETPEETPPAIYVSGYGDGAVGGAGASASANVDVDETHLQFNCVPEGVCGNSSIVKGHPEEAQRSHTWTKSSTKFFLEAFLVRAEKFRDPKIKKRILWTEIVFEMQKIGFVGVTEDVLDRKMRNLKKTYRGIKDNNRSTSTGRGTVSWEFFDIFEQIFSRDATINFGATISSFQPVEVPPMTVPTPSPSPAASCSSVITTHSAPTSPTSPTSPASFLTESPTCSSNSNSSNAERRKEKNKSGREVYTIRKKLLKIEEERVESIRTLTQSIMENNNIQRERNELLREYLSKH